MLEQVLDTIATKLEAKGISFRGRNIATAVVLDRESFQRQVNWGKVDPNLKESAPIALGLDYYAVPTPSFERARLSSPNTTVSPTGAITVEQALNWVDHTIYVGLYMRETMDVPDRALSINKVFVRNQEKILNALGAGSRVFEFPVLDLNGVPRGFSYSYEGGLIDEQRDKALEYLAKYRIRVNYPLTDGLESFSGGRIATHYTLQARLSVADMLGIDLTVPIADPPLKGVRIHS